MAFEIENGVLEDYTEEDGVTEAVIPEGVTKIGAWVFARCRKLKRIIIPESVTSIGNNAFWDCVSLESVNIPEGVTSIEDVTFFGCRNLTSISIPEGVTSIGNCAFYGCTGLTSLTLPERLNSIGADAFHSCKSLAGVSFPDSVTSIGKGAFLDTLWLEHYPDDLVIINGILIRYKGTGQALTIPENVVQIGRDAFDSAVYPQCLTVYGITIKPKKLKAVDLHHAMNMLMTKDFSVQFSLDVKYAAAVGFYLKTNDADVEVYIKRRILRIIRFLIDSSNIAAIRKLLDKKIVTKKEIDTCIACAVECGKTEISIMLLHYKSEVLGYADPADAFKL